MNLIPRKMRPLRRQIVGPQDRTVDFAARKTRTAAQQNHRMNPRGFKLAFRNFRRSLIAAHTASAAMCPLRAALSIVEGQPV